MCKLLPVLQILSNITEYIVCAVINILFTRGFFIYIMGILSALFTRLTWHGFAAGKFYLSNAYNS